MVADIARAAGQPVSGFIDDDPRVAPATLNADHKSDLVRVGVSYKFEWWTAPAAVVAPEPPVIAKD